MLMNMFFRHLVTIFMIILFSIKLGTRKSFRDMETKYFDLTVISCVILVVEDTLEFWASTDPSLRLWRILFSIIGYTFRSIAALSLLLVIVPKGKRSLILCIPSVITFLVTCTAFFTDIAFGYDEEYQFYRGPLGYVVFIIPIFYTLLLLVETFRHITDNNGIEKIIVPVCVVFSLTASFVDSYAGGIRLNEALMICGIFFYIFLYSHDNRRDPLTGLLNRQAFYDDCTLMDKNICAVALIDMNGLKELNDTKGHQAGDDALINIGNCIKETIDSSTQAYRIGGDEFVLLFFKTDKKTIDDAKKRIKEHIAQKGYSISMGCSMKDGDKDLDRTIKESDRLMYEDKSRYYKENGKERRKK